MNVSQIYERIALAFGEFNQELGVSGKYAQYGTEVFLFWDELANTRTRVPSVAAE